MQNKCYLEEIRKAEEFILAECVRNSSTGIFWKVQIQTFSFAAKIGHLCLFDLAQLDDLWFEAMLNEHETIENGIVALVDMCG